MEKLKLCPFCGGTPEMNCFEGADTSMTYLRVKCASCGAAGGHIITESYHAKVAESAAAAMWNLREGVAGATVRRGQWNDFGEPLQGFTCSVCGYTLPLMGKPNFCPHCGAKMDSDAKG